MLELFFHAHIGGYMEVLVDEKELVRIALSCSIALFGAPLPQKEASVGLHPTLRPARLTQIVETGLQFVGLFLNWRSRTTSLSAPFHVASRTRRRGSVTMCLLYLHQGGGLVRKSGRNIIHFPTDSEKHCVNNAHQSLSKSAQCLRSSWCVDLSGSMQGHESSGVDMSIPENYKPSQQLNPQEVGSQARSHPGQKEPRETTGANTEKGSN